MTNTNLIDYKLFGRVFLFNNYTNADVDDLYMNIDNDFVYLYYFVYNPGPIASKAFLKVAYPND